MLSIFFMGLGLGSLWGGRLADRSRSPLRLYGFFEIGIGIWALLFILLIDRGEGVVVSLLQAFQAGRAGAVALRAVLSLAFLIVPVTLMGATLPLLARFVTAQAQVRGARIGALYTVNTLGAVCGCAVTGFYLLAEQGYTRTTLVGAAANVAVGVLALVLAAVTSRGHAEPATAAARDEAVFTESEAPRAYVRGLLLVAYAISGFCALALEVLWTRLLGIMFFGTTYAFTTMLTTLLCGIAVGSAVASVLVDRSRHRMSLLGWVEAAIGVACLLMLLGLRRTAGEIRGRPVCGGIELAQTRLDQIPVVVSCALSSHVSFRDDISDHREGVLGRPRKGRPRCGPSLRGEYLRRGVGRVGGRIHPAAVPGDAPGDRDSGERPVRHRRRACIGVSIKTQGDESRVRRRLGRAVCRCIPRYAGGCRPVSSASGLSPRMNL